jgi:hypothetical protein
MTDKGSSYPTRAIVADASAVSANSLASTSTLSGRKEAPGQHLGQRPTDQVVAIVMA